MLGTITLSQFGMISACCLLNFEIRSHTYRNSKAPCNSRVGVSLGKLPIVRSKLFCRLSFLKIWVFATNLAGGPVRSHYRTNEHLMERQFNVSADELLHCIPIFSQGTVWLNFCQLINNDWHYDPYKCHNTFAYWFTITSEHPSNLSNSTWTELFKQI